MRSLLEDPLSSAHVTVLIPCSWRQCGNFQSASLMITPYMGKETHCALFYLAMHSVSGEVHSAFSQHTQSYTFSITCGPDIFFPCLPPTVLFCLL